MADAAYEIQKEEQRKTIEVTTANADIAKQEREIELKQKEVAVKEQALEAEVKKQAEADKYEMCIRDRFYPLYLRANGMIIQAH